MLLTCMQELFDRLPPIQKKYLNKEIFSQSWDFVQRYGYDIEKIKKVSTNENIVRYSKLIIRYSF